MLSLQKFKKFKYSMTPPPLEAGRKAKNVQKIA